MTRPIAPPEALHYPNHEGRIAARPVHATCELASCQKALERGILQPDEDVSWFNVMQNQRQKYGYKPSEDAYADFNERRSTTPQPGVNCVICCEPLLRDQDFLFVPLSG